MSYRRASYIYNRQHVRYQLSRDGVCVDHGPIALRQTSCLATRTRGNSTRQAVWCHGNSAMATPLSLDVSTWLKTRLRDGAMCAKWATRVEFWQWQFWRFTHFVELRLLLGPFTYPLRRASWRAAQEALRHLRLHH
jgi:hypothetical protein